MQVFFALHLQKGEAIVWLTPSRKQRMRALNVLRSRLPDGVLAGSMGRASEIESAMQEDTEWQLDAESINLVSGYTKDLIAEAKVVEQWLKDNKDKQPGDVEFEDWKRHCEDLHCLSIQIYDAKNLAWKKICEDIRIWCLTVDGFLQIISGKSYLSRHFESVKLRLAIGDEFHQLDLQKMYTISWFVSTCICFYDEAQHIAFFRYGD